MIQSLPRVSLAGKAPAGTDPAAPRGGQGWTVRIDPAFFNAERNPLSPSAKLLACVLDSMARMTPFVWASNAGLAAELGISARRCQELLAELERAGWIAPVFLDARKRTRLGIALRRRVGPATPAADTPERLALVEEAIRAGWRPDRAHPDHRHWLRALGQDGADAPTRDPAHPERGGVRTPEREKPRQKNDPPFREKTKGKSKASEADRRDDQRPTPPNVPPAAEVIESPDDLFGDPPKLIAKAPIVAEDSHLARRTPAERERFRQLAPDVQARVLSLLGRGDRPARESARRLLEPMPSAKPAPSALTLPALTFADRCRAMEATGDRRLVSGFASSLALNLGTRTDQRLFGEFVKLGDRLCTGSIPAAAMIDAAHAAFRPGVGNHGAYLWATLKRDPTCAPALGG